ncbi:thymidylate synthase [Paenibacillus chitinolyticus]|uniref:thymidylate synthase n=1 Tax=Paenibacillus chitinolyticus TaxID=79263 RepID=UPI003D03FF0F
MSVADIHYLELVENVIDYGYYDQNRTGIHTKKAFGAEFRFNLQAGFPILTSKFVAFKTAVKEMLWIYQDQSNDVNLLRDKYGVKVWDEWAGEDGTIGKAYGYQVKKFGLIDKLIHTLKTNPQDRGMVMSLWNNEDLPHMNLRPCAFQTIWDVADGYLNCQLVQRSADLGLGVPFNFTQYAVLMHMIAQVTGHKVGTLWHTMANAHVYENHIEALGEQLKRPIHPTPKLWINPEVKDFYDFKPDDFKLIGYKHSGKLMMDVAV